jgi:hypothetical protein
MKVLPGLASSERRPATPTAVRVTPSPSPVAVPTSTHTRDGEPGGWPRPLGAS